MYSTDWGLNVQRSKVNKVLVHAMKVRNGGERLASRLGRFTSVPIEQSRSGYFGGGKNHYTENL